MMLLKKTYIMLWPKKITDITNLATNTTFNATMNETKNEITSITKLVLTLSTEINEVKNKIPSLLLT